MSESEEILTIEKAEEKPDLNKAFTSFQEARADNLKNKRALAEEQATFMEALEEYRNHQASFKGKPSNYVRVITDGGPNHDEKIATSVPCYNLLDDERKPVKYRDCIIVGTVEDYIGSGPAILVRYPAWEEDFEIIPLITITDFALSEEA